MWVCTHAQMVVRRLCGCLRMCKWRHSHECVGARLHVQISCAEVSACGGWGRRSVSAARSGSGHELAPGCRPGVGDLCSIEEASSFQSSVVNLNAGLAGKTGGVQALSQITSWETFPTPHPFLLSSQLLPEDSWVNEDS